MSKTLVGTLNINGAFVHTNLAVGGVSGRNIADNINHAQVFTVLNGTGAGKADLPYQEEFDIAGAGNRSMDLAGVLTDAFGAVLTDVVVKILMMSNVSVAANPAAHVYAGPHLTAGWVTGPWKGISGTNDQPGTEIPVGGVNVFARADAAGWAVTATTGDILYFKNQHGTQTARMKVTILGASAAS